MSMRSRLYSSRLGVPLERDVLPPIGTSTVAISTCAGKLRMTWNGVIRGGAC